ncbi:MAG: glutamate--tRNA ligase family protein [Phycisphaerales bacterium]
MRDRPEITRLAPSPTGSLHLGNARTFLVNWAMARRRGWRIVLRIEDLDSPRVKAGTDREAMDLLAWLGIGWDEGPTYQSVDLEPYRKAMRALARAGLVYPSGLTRTEIEAAIAERARAVPLVAPEALDPHTSDSAEAAARDGDADGSDAASAPQEGSHEVVFPAWLRPTAIGPCAFDDEGTNWRLVADSGPIGFVDAFAGRRLIDVGQTIGDFVVWTKRGVPAYQLAVVVDDARQGVTRVVRGDDLLDSTARQILVARALGLAHAPTHTHLPLVRGPDGRRLAKRHGDTRLTSYRAAGVPAERIIGLLAAWSGIGERRIPTPMTAGEFLDRFDLSRMPAEPVVMAPEDDAWLRCEAHSG